MDQLSALDGPELVFGLVGAVGSELDAVTRTLSAELGKVRYKVEEIRVSALLHQLDRDAQLGNGVFGSKYERIREHMKAGTELRNATGAGEVMALLAIAAIRQRRISRQPGCDEIRTRVTFEPFVGVAPTIYTEMFRAPERKDREGNAVIWIDGESGPRLKRFVPSYLLIETR